LKIFKEEGMRGLAERNVRRGLRRQLGLTLIETMIVLAIAAVAIALVLKPVRAALSNMRSSDEVGELARSQAPD
jgi:prepilin-type N-terminal cleavage/methylation domain-containing protein